jgi:hypothetical protein
VEKFAGNAATVNERGPPARSGIKRGSVSVAQPTLKVVYDSDRKSVAVVVTSEDTKSAEIIEGPCLIGPCGSMSELGRELQSLESQLKGIRDEARKRLVPTSGEQTRARTV